MALLGSSLLYLVVPDSSPLPAMPTALFPTEASSGNSLLESLISQENADETVFEGSLPVVLDTFIYRVQPNDTLDGISRRYGIRVETLISLNSIRDVRRLQAGTPLKIPNIDGVVHVVQRGDSLAALAARYGTTIIALADANDLSSQVLAPGQAIFVPGARMAATELKRALGTLIIWPLRGPISSGYGYRNSPITGVRQFHSGIDIVAAMNAPIRASVDGRVAETGYSAIYGNFVILNHFDGYQTLYAHLSRISVRNGQRLNQGDTVGLLGSTGLSTGPHLHFGVYRNGRAINPLTFLQGL